MCDDDGADFHEFSLKISLLAIEPTPVGTTAGWADVIFIKLCWGAEVLSNWKKQISYFFLYKFVSSRP